jgi:hypothetical protein
LNLFFCAMEALLSKNTFLTFNEYGKVSAVLVT